AHGHPGIAVRPGKHPPARLSVGWRDGAAGHGPCPGNLLFCPPPGHAKRRRSVRPAVGTPPAALTNATTARRYRGPPKDNAMRSFQLPGRSTVHSRGGMCAASHPLASLHAVDVMSRGGNAVDAAVTASAVLCVAEPHMTGIGGDCFAMVARADGTVIGLNASGRAALAADAGWLARSGLSEIDYHSIHAVTVPGAVDGWARLLDAHGTIDLAEALAPAIRLAEDGVVVAPRVASDWARHVELLARDEGGRMHLLRDGKAP